MAKEWITSKEIMDEYGKAASEIGQACYEGVLHAYRADVLTPIVEESKLAHIPKYPPPGINPHDHIQCTATPFWDWSDHVKITGLGDHDFEGLNLTAVNNVYKQKYFSGTVDKYMIVPTLALGLMERSYDYAEDNIGPLTETLCSSYPIFYKCFLNRPQPALAWNPDMVETLSRCPQTKSLRSTSKRLVASVLSVRK